MKDFLSDLCYIYFPLIGPLALVILAGISSADWLGALSYGILIFGVYTVGYLALRGIELIAEKIRERKIQKRVDKKLGW